MAQTTQERLDAVRASIAKAAEASEYRTADGTVVKRDLAGLMALERELEGKIATEAAGGGEVVRQFDALGRVHP